MLTFACDLQVLLGRDTWPVEHNSPTAWHFVLQPWRQPARTCACKGRHARARLTESPRWQRTHCYAPGDAGTGPRWHPGTHTAVLTDTPADTDVYSRTPAWTERHKHHYSSMEGCAVKSWGFYLIHFRTGDDFMKWFHEIIVSWEADMYVAPP